MAHPILNRLLRRSDAAGKPGLVLDEYLDAYRRSPQTRQHIKLSVMEEPHCRLGCSMHRDAGSAEPHPAAFLYSIERLPSCMDRVNKVILAPGTEAFDQAGYIRPTDWPKVGARARRRQAHFDGRETLALVLISISDLDDVITSLCAYQIEWNKIHALLSHSEIGKQLIHGAIDATSASEDIRCTLGVSRQDWDMFIKVWGAGWGEKITAAAKAPKDLIVDRLPMGEIDFEAAAEEWWNKVLDHFNDLNLLQRPVYLVSANNHSLANIISGYSRSREKEIRRHVESLRDETIKRYWAKARFEPGGILLNLLYYGQKLYLEAYPELEGERIAMEEAAGVRRHLPACYPHLEAQVLDLSCLNNGLDPRLKKPPQKSKAVVINWDYPLGSAARHLLTCGLRRFPGFRGIYILGKSAAMIGRLGDVMIPSMVHDVHSEKIIRFNNALSLRRLLPYIDRIAAFEDQKTITVRGTFLHSWETVSHLHIEDYTGIEMEAGPYLSALYDYFHSDPAKGDRVIRVSPPGGLDIGVIHYTSDTPYNVRASLLNRRLGLAGLEATYAGSLAILNRIFELEAGAG